MEEKCALTVFAYNDDEIFKFATSRFVFIVALFAYKTSVVVTSALTFFEETLFDTVILLENVPLSPTEIVPPIVALLDTLSAFPGASARRGPPILA